MRGKNEKKIKTASYGKIGQPKIRMLLSCRFNKCFEFDIQESALKQKVICLHFIGCYIEQNQ